MSNLQQIAPAQPPVLPTTGLSKWPQIKPFLPIGRETWRKLGLEGKAPRPIKLSETCAVYRNEQVLRWIADPLNYTEDVV
ncbi:MULTISPECIES: helix-turn-helix transcriptional regulator [Paraburkholderia]|uniref:helix-turn-helix transcriptional regulator n=1 Tax=Paraburkholderia TaxID=1822464 RepID=UPI0038BB7075